MPYRAPELFDVKTGKTLDEKVDIWSLGCTLFAVAYGHSPFETEGSSIGMAVTSGRYRHPAKGGYSDKVKGLVDACLVVDPEQRPDINKVSSARLLRAFAIQRRCALECEQGQRRQLMILGDLADRGGTERVSDMHRHMYCLGLVMYTNACVTGLPKYKAGNMQHAQCSAGSETRKYDRPWETWRSGLLACQQRWQATSHPAWSL